MEVCIKASVLVATRAHVNRRAWMDALGDQCGLATCPHASGRSIAQIRPPIVFYMTLY